MINVIFRNKTIAGYATVKYASNDPEEVVVEMSEEQLRQIVGVDNWEDVHWVVSLENSDAEISANVESTPEGSKKLSAKIANVQFRLLSDLSPEDLEFILSKYPSYEVDFAYSEGKKFVYRSKLYKVVQAHTSQSGWQPDLVPALYTEVMPEGVIGPWRQPLGAHDAYMTGDRVLFNGEVYISKIDNNVWSPDVYGWELETSGEEYPKWVQPRGAHDAYALGAIVTHNGQLWISIVDSNVWEPGVYGWEIYS